MSRFVPLFLALVLALAVGANALHTFPGYRMLQYDQVGTAVGTNKASFNLAGAVASSSSVAGSLAIVNVEALSSSQAIEALITEQSASGVLILLPEDGSAGKVDLALWKKIEANLTRSTFNKIPVYFAHRSAELDKMLAEIDSDGGIGSSAVSFLSGESVRFELTTREPTPIKDAEVLAIEGHLNGGKKADSDLETIPTIALVAHVDSFSVAPQLAYGASSSASGVAALLELSRLWSTLYAGAKTLPSYNLIFLVENGGKHSFIGSKMFLDKAEAKLIDNMAVAISIDSLGAKELFLHVSRSEKEPSAKKLYDIIESTAQRFKVPLTVVHKKINASDTYVPWAHEQFARQKILGVTLSSLTEAPERFGTSNLFDRQVNAKLLAENVKFIAEALAAYIYETNVEVFKNELAVSESYLDSLVRTLTRFPRASPFLSQHKEAAVVVDAVEKELGRFTKDVRRKTIAFPTDEFVFYNRTSGTVTAYRGKTFVFDLIETLAVAAYLFAFYAYFVGVREAYNDVYAYFFKRNSAAKKR